MKRTGAAADDGVLYEVLNFLGIAYQLATTRVNRILADGELPFAQFVMLSHLSKFQGRPRTVGGIAAAFQAPQPGITKTIQKLVRRGYATARPSAEDARRKLIEIAPAGLAAFRAAIARIAPDARLIFADWPVADVAALRDLLRELKDWLDANRETRAESCAPRRRAARA